MKVRKSIKKLLACITAMAMLLGMSATVMASEGFPGDENNPVTTISITKELKVAAGITIPDEDFVFEIKKVSVDGDTTLTDSMPTLGTNGQVSLNLSDLENDKSGSFEKATGNILEEIIFPHAGVYTYTITESDTAAAEGMTYSKANYTLRVYVKNNGEQTTIYTATIDQILNDAEKEGAGKVDEMRFVNTYVKEAGEFGVSKMVEGDYADKTKLFAYTLNFIFPDTAGGVVNYAYEINDNGESKKGEAKDTQVKFNLAHGDQVKFTGLPAGTTYTLVEAGTPEYEPKVTVVEDGEGTTVPGVLSQELSTGNRLLGEGANSAAWVNRRENITVTGVLVDNLPFILMIIVAVGAFALYIIAKRRRAIR